MNSTSAQHDTFVIERRLASSPARVFAAFADQKKKARWFGCVDGWEVAEHTLDFRVGGREVWRGGPPGDTPHRNDTYYHDIVPDERIVWSYAMQVAGMEGEPERLPAAKPPLDFHMAIDQATGIISGKWRDDSYPLPRFLWCNFTLTDSAMHEGGPHSEIAAASIRDSDARLGEILDAVERAGILDDTAFVLVADHGMEENDPAVNGDWDVPLKESGLTFRDEAYGFVYLGVS